MSSWTSPHIGDPLPMRPARSWPEVVEEIEYYPDGTVKKRTIRRPGSPYAEPVLPWSSQCPCNPSNGGSGICGCILGGPWINC